MSAAAGDLPAWPTTSAPDAPPWGAWVRSRSSGLGLSASRAAQLAQVLAALAQADDDTGAVLRILADSPALGEARFPPPLPTARARLAAWCWSLPLVSAGRDPAWEDARAFAFLVAMTASLGRLALARTPEDAGPDLTDPDVSMVLGLAGPSARIAAAGRVIGPVRVLHLRGALGAPAAQRALEAEAAPRWAALPATDPLVARLRAGWDHAMATLRFQALAALARADPWARGVPADLLARDRAAAIDALHATPDAAASWEHQRWGLANDPTPLVGNDYVRATVLRALHAAGAPDARDRLATLVASRPAATLRYYGAWDRLPPDADSLGLFLLCARDTGAARPAQVAAWLSVVRPSLRADGLLPTWLTEGPGGPTTPEPRWDWGGDDCTASRTVAVTGLLAWDAAAWLDVVEPNLSSILDDHDSGLGGSFYYDPAWATALLQQLAERPEVAALSVPLRARLLERVQRSARLAARRQGADGGWGDPQTTAATAPLLSLLPGQEVAILRALRYLSEHQRPDGTWGASPFFLTIGKPPYSVHPHRGPELTTALCLLGMARTLPVARS